MSQPQWVKRSGAASASIFRLTADLPIESEIACLVTDGGGEYDNYIFKSLCLARGIKHSVTMPYESDTNGRAERAWSKLLPLVRCMLSESNLGHKHWPCAFRQAAYILNITPTSYKKYSIDQGGDTAKPEIELLTPWYVCKHYHPDLKRLIPF